MANSLWLREIKRNKIVKDCVVACPDMGWEQALVAGCRQLDLEVPMIMQRHRQDMADFGQLRFLPEHFLESVGFDRLEVERFDPDEKKKARR